MNLRFKNLGPIEDAEIDLEDLTIICGENNTGKTYITYLVYCLLAKWKYFIDINLKNEMKSLKEKGIVKINLQQKIAEPWKKICSDALNRFKDNLPEMFASKSEFFSNFEININIPLGTTWQEQEFKNEIRSKQGNLLLTISKQSNSCELELAAPQSEEKSKQSMDPLSNFIAERLFNIVLEEAIPNVFIASSERTGATIFKKQLNLATSNIIELLTQVHREGKGISPDKLFKTMYGHQEYALPVRDNVKFINQLPDTNTEDSELLKTVPNLMKRFENIVGGTYSTNRCVFRSERTTIPI